MLPEELVDRLQLSPSFRGTQIFQALHHNHIQTIPEITTLPARLRTTLQQEYTLFSSRPDKEYLDSDGTVKVRVLLRDGSSVETVLLTDRNGRRTCCLSTQVGCGMGCTFCKTAQLGLSRNLDAGEIVEQVLHLEHAYGPIANVVFMGMGEPLSNLNNVRKAVEILHHPEGLNIGYRKMTISTCGLVDALYGLGENGPPVRLAISLVTAQEDLRERLIPVTRSNPLPELKKALLYYQKLHRKRITMEYVLFANTNEGVEQVEALKQFCKGLSVVINVIPWNQAPDLPFEEPSEKQIGSFVRTLEEEGFPVTRRFRRGKGINGACGLLGETSRQHH